MKPSDCFGGDSAVHRDWHTERSPRIENHGCLEPHREPATGDSVRIEVQLLQIGMKNRFHRHLGVSGNLDQKRFGMFLAEAEV